ncbi:MAG TPA: GH116 family glycosyl-hydrolase [Candidatus Dormibacteraeota bacterium]|nr:GH116 family glycosyl-hydrolase [Candidatus Dormibacteraeota bacterium]
MPRDWPVLRTYVGRQLDRIAMPLGGIGTGTVSLGGRGQLRDWEVVNRPAKGFAPTPALFALRVQARGSRPLGRVLEGPIPLEDYEGGHGSPVSLAGLPRFRKATFEAAYPLAQVSLEDPELPCRVRLRAWNPLLPPDPEPSGLPVALLRYRVANTGSEPMSASVCGSLRNFIGVDGTNGEACRNRNTARASEGLRGLLLSSDGVDPGAEQWGTIALAVRDEADVSTRTAWSERSWSHGPLDFWDDLLDDGHLEERESRRDDPVASLCAGAEIEPGEEHEFSFLLAWHFPNRGVWSPEPGDPPVGNHYATRHRDAWAVVEDVAGTEPELERGTVDFVAAVSESDLPPAVREAALFNLSTLRTQTCFRTADGHFFGWEGCSDRVGSCHGSCTHVWNYEQATAFLFAPLARSLRDVEFAHGMDDRGHMSFRVGLPLSRARDWPTAAADGQMGCLIKLYRDWRLSSADELLELWPRARGALAFAWEPGGWDADRDGVMEGCQHNTMDVEFFGPNPWMNCWYLGALRAGEELARAAGDGEFAATCRDLFERGGRWMDENLFNGEYYQQQVHPIPEGIAPGLRLDSREEAVGSMPAMQIGTGCALDQLAGQFVAHVAGLGPLLDQDHVQAAMSGIIRHNRRTGFQGHMNPMRTYVLGDEEALLMAAYPGERPVRPFPYFGEVMTGFEYAFACQLAFSGRTEEGVRVAAAIRERYDGERRNPFDEAECGHHYARAMASWALIQALTGFDYEAGSGRMRFAAAEGPVRWIWASGDAWGTVRQELVDGARRVAIDVHAGRLALDEVELRGVGSGTPDRSGWLGAGDSVEVRFPTV